MNTDEKAGFSQIYKILVELKRPDIPAFIGKWEKELGITLSETEVATIWKRLSVTSVNSKLLELNYKCMTRMYMTPEKMHKINGERSWLCWRGCGEIGTMAHVWWTCPEMGLFWEEIKKFIREITHFDLPKDPKIFLFHLYDMPTKTYLRTLLPHFIDAAKTLIAKNWKRKERPTMREWFNKMNEIQELEYLRFSEGIKMEAYKIKWGVWEKFKNSPRSIEMWTT